MDENPQIRAAIFGGTTTIVRENGAVHVLLDGDGLNKRMKLTPRAGTETEKTALSYLIEREFLDAMKQMERSTDARRSRHQVVYRTSTQSWLDVTYLGSHLQVTLTQRNSNEHWDLTTLISTEPDEQVVLDSLEWNDHITGAIRYQENVEDQYAHELARQLMRYVDLVPSWRNKGIIRQVPFAGTERPVVPQIPQVISETTAAGQVLVNFKPAEGTGFASLTDFTPTGPQICVSAIYRRPDGHTYVLPQQELNQQQINALEQVVGQLPHLEDSPFGVEVVQTNTRTFSKFTSSKPCTGSVTSSREHQVGTFGLNLFDGVEVRASSFGYFSTDVTSGDLVVDSFSFVAGEQGEWRGNDEEILRSNVAAKLLTVANQAGWRYGRRDAPYSQVRFD